MIKCRKKVHYLEGWCNLVVCRGEPLSTRCSPACLKDGTSPTVSCPIYSVGVWISNRPPCKDIPPMRLCNFAGATSVMVITTFQGY